MTVLVTYLMIRIAARLGRYEAGVAAVFIFNLVGCSQSRGRGMRGKD